MTDNVAQDNSGEPGHPGRFVRDTVLAPKKLSVTAAARLVGVGRPAFSNFVNGRVAATLEMAKRIEVAFGLPARRLLDMQAAFDAARSQLSSGAEKAIPYVPPFLRIKATQVEAWVDRNIPARIRLAVLLRTLVHSTCDSVTAANFPGNDDAERRGWDGFVESTRGAAFVPRGRSGWEFGVDKDVKKKADSDFKSRVETEPKAERDETTFVFVTPRYWAGKNAWARDQKAKRNWKDVRAYDSSDLEQWLEHSVAAQAWFASETHIPSTSVRSLDRCWLDWADVASPPLEGRLFVQAVDLAKETLARRLSSAPDGPTIIAADSADEGLAFLAQVFGAAGGSTLFSLRDRVVVFDEPGVFPQLAQGATSFIATTAKRSVEAELAPYARRMHTVVVYPRNAINTTPHVVLEPVSSSVFRDALDRMGLEPDAIARYSEESGRSLTVLRRRLATVPAIQTPAWATVAGYATDLVPFLFAGAWDAANASDQGVLTGLANEPAYEAVERMFQRLLVLDGAPVWSVGHYRGIVSKIDLLFAISGALVASDLNRFFALAKRVLSEDDPGLDLPDEKRWAAAIYGKSRAYSAALRDGIAETLVLLTVHGSMLSARLGIDCAQEAARLVREMLSPVRARTLEAHERDLPAYVEAVPDTFLSIIEGDLRSADPECYGLLRPVVPGSLGGGCARTGLLWALEAAAWNPANLPRVVLILGQLAQIEIDDNWLNKPINSLSLIFCAWMPQTAADHQTRTRAMKLLAERYPEVAWRICIEELTPGPKTGHYSYKPKWRNDGYGYGEPLRTHEPIQAFTHAVFEMAVSWKGGHTASMLCDLIQCLEALASAEQGRVWGLVEEWLPSAGDDDRAAVREKVRLTALTRRARRNSRNVDTGRTERAKEIYSKLQPTDLVARHKWLFVRQWVDESADELADDRYDHAKREEWIKRSRVAALKEVYADKGALGVCALAESGEAAAQVGYLMASTVASHDDTLALLQTALSSEPTWPRSNLVRGVLNALSQLDGQFPRIVADVRHVCQEDQVLRLLLLAPFAPITWQVVNSLSPDAHQRYWREVSPGWIGEGDAEAREACSRLLAARRPRAAFATIQLVLDKVGAELLYQVLSEIARGGIEQEDQYRLDPHHVGEAFTIINASPVLTLDQRAGLEFAFLEALASPRGSGLQSLEQYVERHPDLFVQAIVWSYKRKDGGEDPASLEAPTEARKHYAERGYKLIEALTRLPGHDPEGVLRGEILARWIKQVRDACADLGRQDIADICIGKLLSHCPEGADGIWPCEVVRQVAEETSSTKIMDGMHNGRYNARGVVLRGERGDQERQLASQYRVWSESLRYSHPLVASELLAKLAATYEYQASHEDMDADVRARLM